MSDSDDWDVEDDDAPPPPPPPAPVTGDDSDWGSESEEETKTQPKSQPAKPAAQPSKPKPKPAPEKPKPAPEEKSDPTPAEPESETISSSIDTFASSMSKGTQSKKHRKLWHPKNIRYRPISHDYGPPILAGCEIPHILHKEGFSTMMEKWESHSEDFNLETRNGKLLEFGMAMYAQFVPIYGNVGDDNHRPFMVDLDALLLDLFHSPLLDWAHGPQTLPLIFLLESRLELFCSGGRSVQMIAFDCNRHLWKYPQHLFLREVVLYHLIYHWQYQQQLIHKHPYPLVFVFNDFWTEPFCKFVHTYLPVFALTGRPEHSPVISDENRYLLLFENLYLSALEIPCVQSTEVTYRSNAMFGFQYSIPIPVVAYIKRRLRNASEVAMHLKLKPLAAPLQNPQMLTPPNNALLANLVAAQSITATPKESKDDMRHCIILYGLISMLKEKNRKLTTEEWDFLRLVLLHIVLLSEVPLRYRSQQLPRLKDFDTMDEIDDDSEYETSDDEDEDAEPGLTVEGEMKEEPNDKEEPKGKEESGVITIELPKTVKLVQPEPEAPKPLSKKGKYVPPGARFAMEQEEQEQKEKAEALAAQPTPPPPEIDDKDVQAALHPPESWVTKTSSKESQFNAEDLLKRCWWKHLDFLAILNDLSVHCASVLSHNYNLASKSDGLDFEKFILQFQRKEISDNPKDNPLVEFAPHTAVDIFDGRLLCQLLGMGNKALLSGVKAMGLSPDSTKVLQNLFASATEELAFADEKIMLFPILQSQSALSIQFEDVTPPKKHFDHAFANIDSPIIKELVGDLENELEDNGLIYHGRGMKGFKQRIAKQNHFYKAYKWKNGAAIKDRLKPYVYHHKIYQDFIKFIEKYSQSLEGGKIVLRDVIVSSKPATAEEEDTKPKKGHQQQRHGKGNKKGGKKGGGGGKFKKNDVREQAQAAILKKQQEEKLEKIRLLINLLTTQFKDLESRIRKLDTELSSISDPISALPGLETLHTWCAEAAVNSKPERDMYPAVRLWQVTFDIARRFIKGEDEPLSPNDVVPSIPLVQNMQKALHLLNFPAPAEKLAHLYVKKVNQQGRTTLSVKDVLLPFRSEAARITVGASYPRFQMDHCGPYMIRGLGSKPDARVTGFYPDRWQVKLLDIADRRQSALVVAPTSSGKTFVSYYAMKEILQRNASTKNAKDKGVIVYVAPSKALLWQASADIYSKYGDVFGAFTLDYTHKPLEAQVLVVVPESFEYILMSPQRYEWISQIQYVIFDEIHCLGKSEGGEIWERLLMLIRCPFFALSATVGHPEVFAEWLNRVDNVMRDPRRDKYKHKVHFVHFDERWSDLEKYIYLPDSHIFKGTEIREKPVYVGSYGADFKTASIKLHPAGAIAMGLGLDKHDEFPPGLHFSPQDSLYLFDAMWKHVNELPPVYNTRLQELHPDTFFGGDMYVVKRRANEFARRLKREIRFWIVGLFHWIPDVTLDEKEAMDAARDALHFDDSDLIFDPKDDKQTGKRGKRGRQQQHNKQQHNKQQHNKQQHNKQQHKQQHKPKPKPAAKHQKKNKAVPAKEQQEEEKKVESPYDEAELSAEEKGLRKSLVEKVLRSLADYPLQRINRMEESSQSKGVEDCYGDDFVFDNFTQMVLDLEVHNRLPALVFCLNQVKCEKLFYRFLDDIEKLEEAEDVRRRSNIDVEVQVQRRREEKRRDKERKKLAKKLEQMARNKASEDAMPEDEYEDALADFDAQDSKDFRFTFCQRGSELDSEVQHFWTRRLTRRKILTEKHPLMRALSRGIGLHHMGLPGQYLRLVETFFRYRHLRVVISDGSLAMGVNMPARTVVFAGDDPTLNPLNYRQMMGRAGRRGYDNVGHVMFFGIKPRKISYLLTSQLTSLTGHFPINSTLPLRAIQLNQGYTEAENGKFALSVLKNMFHPPFSGSAVKRRIEFQIRHQFRFSLEYQLQRNFLNLKGELSGLGSLVAHLHQYEPDNFAFARVVESGLLHQLCKGYNKIRGDAQCKKKKEARNKLMLVFCHIFVRHPLPTNYDPSLNPKLRDSFIQSSFLELPSLHEQPDKVLRAIDRLLKLHNAETRNMFSEYFRIFAATDLEAHGGLSSEQLPQSKISVQTKDSTEDDKSPLLSQLKESSKPYDARSPYCAVSGLEDNFQTTADFVESLRSDMAVEPSSIPLSEWRDLRGRYLRLNAYAYDFLQHESLSKLKAENNMGDELAWGLLKEFDTLFQAIDRSLQYISSIATQADALNAEIKQKIEELDTRYTKVRQHKWSIYRHRGQHYMDNETQKIITAGEYKKKKEDLVGKVIGDDFVCAFKDLQTDFYEKLFPSKNVPGGK